MGINEAHRYATMPNWDDMKITAVLIVASSLLSLNAHGADVAKAGKALIRNSLKDPESARFRDTFVNGPNYCGFVNAKNSYGGYIGFKRFIAMADASVILEAAVDEAGLFEAPWRNACWSKEKLVAYKKKQDAVSADADKEIERQRSEIRKIAAERDDKDL